MHRISTELSPCMRRHVEADGHKADPCDTPKAADAQRAKQCLLTAQQLVQVGSFDGLGIAESVVAAGADASLPYLSPLCNQMRAHIALRREADSPARAQAARDGLLKQIDAMLARLQAADSGAPTTVFRKATGPRRRLFADQADVRQKD